MLIDSVHDRDLIINDHIRIVRHTVRHDILTLEQVDIVVIDADVLDIIGNKHRVSSPKYIYIQYT